MNLQEKTRKKRKEEEKRIYTYLDNNKLSLAWSLSFTGILPVGGELTCFSADDCHGEVVPLPTMSTPGDCCSEKGLSYEELVGGERECISCFRKFPQRSGFIQPQFLPFLN